MLRRFTRGFESERDDTPPKFATRFELEVCLERDEVDGGWVAEVVNIPGCLSQGETEEEALENIGDAITAVLTARLEAAAAEIRNRGDRPNESHHLVAI